MEARKKMDYSCLTERSALRRKSAKGEERREAILVAAMKRFAEDGYHSASFAAIAEDVGLSLPGLLHYFPTKVQLLLAILDKRDLDSVAYLGGSPHRWRDYLLGLIEIVRMNTTIAGVVRTFAILNAESLTRDHPAEAWFAVRAQTLRATIAGTLRDGIAKGEVNADIRPASVAAEIIAMMDGLQMQWLRQPSDVDMVSIFKDYIFRLIERLERSASDGNGFARAV